MLTQELANGPMAAMIGQRVLHYRILERLGTGGMGVVYKAEDIRLGRTVALKFLYQKFLDDKKAVERFHREARAASALDHPHICTVYDIGEYEGQPFIAMQYLQGQTLKDRIRGEPLSTEEIAGFATQIVDALQAAHSKGIIHRDVKPSNIFITRRNQIKLLDFGIAKVLIRSFRKAESVSEAETAEECDIADALTVPGLPIGTVGYMSPEQIRGQLIDFRTDIFSFGVVLYQMATGVVPFKGRTVFDICDSVLHETPVPPHHLNPQLPSSLVRIIERTLQKKPNSRYQSSNELLNDLNRLKEGHLDVGPNVTPVYEMRPSIAVLPFANMSPDPGDDYFADGLAEDLINALSKLKDLRVVARTSAFKFRGKAVDVREIAQQLNVSSVLEGSIRKAGKRLRVTVRLVDALNGYEIWSERYEYQLDDVFLLQDRITQAVVGTLKVDIEPRGASFFLKRSPRSSDAYNLYWKGRYHWNMRTKENLNRSIEYFKQAIALDSNYALAYTGLADAYNLLGGYELQPPDQVFPAGKAAALKAIEIDEMLSEAHTSLGYVALMYDWDWSVAERHFRRAIEINPGYSLAHQWYASYLMVIDRPDVAFREISLARELDPLSTAVNVQVGAHYYWRRKYDLAIKEFQNVIEMDSNFPTAHIGLALCYFQMSELKKVEFELNKFLALSPENLEFLALGYSMLHQVRKAKSFLRQLKDLSKRQYVSWFDLACIYCVLGETEQALDLLEKSYEQRSVSATWLKHDPLLDPLRHELRFQELLGRLGLPYKLAEN